MFPEHPSQKLEIQKLEIPDGYELVGFAVAVDQNGTPSWLDFIIGGGDW